MLTRFFHILIVPLSWYGLFIDNFVIYTIATFVSFCNFLENNNRALSEDRLSAMETSLSMKKSPFQVSPLLHLSIDCFILHFHFK